jgi:integrase
MGREGAGSERVKLTDRKVGTAKLKADLYEIRDAEESGLRIRVHPGGKRTFVLVIRYPTHPKHATRRALGDYPTMGLAEARKKAREWKRLVGEGIDPHEAEEQRWREQQRRRANTFVSVAEDFIVRHVSKTRKAAVAAREIRREFIDRWGARPITEITQGDVKAVLREAVDRGAPYQAHNLLVHVRSLFNWAIAQDDYGLTGSPCDRIKPKAVIGEKKHRSRVLADPELRAFWSAGGKLAYPFGSFFRMLALTGQRKSEVADAVWSEFDLDKKLWTIPAERMKMDAPHIVPLVPDVIVLLESLPRFASGEHLFSTTFGKKPISGFSKAKRRLDAMMRDQLKKFEPWRVHDIRRTMRTHLSALPIQDRVRELVIAHAQPGLHKVYDQHAYLDEKREALELWAGRLRSIVDPPPDNVIPIDRGAA